MSSLDSRLSEQDSMPTLAGGTEDFPGSLPILREGGKKSPNLCRLGNRSVGYFMFCVEVCVSL